MLNVIQLVMGVTMIMMQGTEVSSRMREVVLSANQSYRREVCRLLGWWKLTERSHCIPVFGCVHHRFVVVHVFNNFDTSVDFGVDSQTRPG
jgi:hypothetical protein